MSAVVLDTCFVYTRCTNVFGNKQLGNRVGLYLHKNVKRLCYERSGHFSDSKQYHGTVTSGQHGGMGARGATAVVHTVRGSQGGRFQARGQREAVWRAWQQRHQQTFSFFLYDAFSGREKKQGRTLFLISFLAKRKRLPGIIFCTHSYISPGGRNPASRASLFSVPAPYF